MNIGSGSLSIIVSVAVVVTYEKGTTFIFKCINIPAVLAVSVLECPLVVFRDVFKIKTIIQPLACRTNNTIHVSIKNGSKGSVTIQFYSTGIFGVAVIPLGKMVAIVGCG